jgi:hypothetical protein
VVDVLLCRGVNKVILKWQRPQWEGDQEVEKRSGRDEPVCFVIHKYMEATVGISWYSYLYLKLAKALCLFYYLLCFLFNKNQRTRGQNRFCLEVGWVGGRWPKCIHVNKCKNDLKKKNQKRKKVFCKIKRIVERKKR